MFKKFVSLSFFCSKKLNLTRCAIDIKAYLLTSSTHKACERNRSFSHSLCTSREGGLAKSSDDKIEFCALLGENCRISPLLFGVKLAKLFALQRRCVER